MIQLDVFLLKYDPYGCILYFMNDLSNEQWSGKKAKELVRDSGRTREWIAEYIGIELQTLTKILNESARPSLPVIKLLAQAIGCKEDDLLGGNQEAS